MRKYASGAQKRKAAEEKRAKEKEALEKVPKIDQMFKAVPSTNSTSKDKSSEIETESSTADADVHPTLTDKMDINEDDDEECHSNESTSAGLAGESSSAFQLFSTDAAMWNIQEDVIALQKFWTSKGRYQRI